MDISDWQGIGRYSQASGESFEEELLFQASRVPHIRLVQQHPPTKFFGPKNAKVVGSAYPDFILYSAAFSAVFDAKRVGKAKNVKISKKRLGQYEFLIDASAVVPAGYVVWWEAHEIIGWHPVSPQSTWPPSVALKTVTKSYVYDLDGRWFRNLVAGLEATSRQ